MASEFFRADHGRKQVEQQQQGDNADDDFHIAWLEFLADADIKRRGDQEQREGQEVNQIVHGVLCCRAIASPAVNGLVPALFMDLRCDGRTKGVNQKHPGRY